MKNLIGNRWADSSNLKTVNIFDPALNKLIDTIPSSTIDDVEICVDTAKKAQKEWANTTLNERCNILLTFKDVVNSESESLAQLLSSETGNTIRETREEIKSIENYITLIIAQASNLYNNVSKDNRNDSNCMIAKSYRPIGVVVSLLPFNTPIESFCESVLSALVMGNSVIAKPSKTCPLTITKLAYLLRKSGVSAGVISILHGPGGTVGQMLSANKDVDLIYLKGRSQTNKEVMTTASRNLTKLVIDVNDNSTFILDRTTNINEVVDDIVKNRFYNAGQMPYTPKRYFIHNKVKEEFTNMLLEKIQSLNVGDPKKNVTDMGCLISESSACNIENKVRMLKAKGSNILCGGKRNGAFYEPTVINVSKETIINDLKDELFGPIIPICGYDDIDELIEIINEKMPNNVVSAYTNDLKIAQKLTNELNTDYVSINKISDINNICNNLLDFSKNKTTIIKNVL